MNNTLTVYKASAGSGKTFTLAAEYIALLVSAPDANEYRHILAVTFTNKATAEMKDRILGQLYGIGFELPQSQPYLDKVHSTLSERGMDMPDAVIREKARRSLTSILHDYTNFRVETIDSFFQSILRSLAHELGLNANMQVDLNTKELTSKAVDRLIDTLSDGHDEIKTWILDYVNSRLSESKDWNITASVKELASCIFREEFQNRSDDERHALNDPSAIKAFRHAMYTIPTQIEQQMMDIGQDVILAVEQMELNFERISRGKSWRNYVEKAMCMEADGMSPTMQNAIAEPTLMLKKADASNAKMQSEAILIAALYEDFARTYRSLRKRYHTARLARQYINELRLLGCIESYCTEIATENNQFTLSRTPALLRSLVDGCDAPFIYERTGITFHHIMIDEFQDTSLMQWDNFRTLFLENASKGGRDLIVGDIKQSIYRWRNGDWKILHGIQEQMQLPEEAIKPLKHNHRSTWRVIKFNNDFFEMMAPELDRIDENATLSLAEIYSDVEQLVPDDTEKDEGHVRLHLFTESELEREDYEQRVAEDMVAQIRSLQSRGLTYNKMAILVRTHNVGERLIQRFRQMNVNIPLISDEAFLLSASVAVQMIITALRVLNDKDTSPVNLCFLAKNYRNTVLREPLSPDQIYMNDSASLLPDELMKNRRQLATEPLYLLCEKLYRMFQLKRIDGQSAYMMAFMDEVLNHVQSNVSDIATFLQAWDEDICRHAIPSSQMDGIRIVSIHQSKGLEYHTVFIPGMEWAVERDRNDENLWCRTHDEQFDMLGSLPIRATKATGNSYYAADYNLEHMQRRVDALNIMYVAFTRAICNLMVWGRYSDDVKPDVPLTRQATSGDLLKLFILKQSDCQAPSQEELLWQIGTPVIKRKKKQTEEKPNRMSPKMKNETQTFASYEPDLQFMRSNASMHFLHEVISPVGADRQEAWEVGIIVHRILSMIHTEADIPRALDTCQREGLIADEQRAKRIVLQLNKGFNNKVVKQWFSADVEPFSEQTITGRSPMTDEPIVRRPDRVVLTPTDIYVVDYKLGSERPGHADQVEIYMRLLAQMYPDRQVHGALWYIMKNKVVDVYLTNKEL